MVVVRSKLVEDDKGTSYLHPPQKTSNGIHTHVGMSECLFHFSFSIVFLPRVSIANDSLTSTTAPTCEKTESVKWTLQRFVIGTAPIVIGKIPVVKWLVPSRDSVFVVTKPSGSDFRQLVNYTTPTDIR